MFRKLNLLLISLIFTNIVFSQTILNTEKLALKVDSGFFFESVSSFSLEQGNSNLVQLSGTGLFGYVYKKHTLKLFGSLKYLMSDKDVILSRNSAQLRHNYNFNEKYRTFAFFQIQNNSALILNKRQLVGFGARRKFNINDSLIIDFGTGLMHELELLSKEKLNSNEKNNYQLFRMANVLSIRYIVNKSISIFDAVYFQPDIENFRDFRFFNELSMQFEVNKHFKIEISFVYRYDSQPPGTLYNRDYNFGTGFIVSI